VLSSGDNMALLFPTSMGDCSVLFLPKSREEEQQEQLVGKKQ